jgi:thiamine pyrophosphokinase
MAVSQYETIWHPADIFSSNPVDHKGFALVVLNQPLEGHVSFYTQVWKNAVYCVGADGGANCVYDLNKSNQDDKNFLHLDTVIGDLDSLRKDSREYWQSRGTEIIYEPDQYSTDLTKAVHHVGIFKIPKDVADTSSGDRKTEGESKTIKDGTRIKDIVCIGGLGGRVDQAMSTLHHLYAFQKEPDYASGKVFLLSVEAISFVLKSGKHKIKVRESFPGMRLGKHIGIIPLKEPSVITTDGLEWDVTDWKTEFGGQISTSNHVRENWVIIETTKDVLFTIDLEFS